MDLIWAKSEELYFCKWGWTPKIKNSLSGKSSPGAVSASTKCTELETLHCASWRGVVMSPHVDELKFASQARSQRGLRTRLARTSGERHKIPLSHSPQHQKYGRDVGASAQIVFGAGTNIKPLCFSGFARSADRRTSFPTSVARLPSAAACLVRTRSLRGALDCGISDRPWDKAGAPARRFGWAGLFEPDDGLARPFQRPVSPTGSPVFPRAKSRAH